MPLLRSVLVNGESRLEALHRALAARAGEPVLFGDLVQAVWGAEPPSKPLPALRTLVKRLRRSVEDEIVTDASGYRLVVRAPAPAQLPADLPDFVGREDELAALSSADAPVLAITGPPGVGKTALAIRLAHRIRDRFPDGQLHVNLRGFATGPAVTVDQALGRFLRSLGVPPAKVPLDRDELEPVESDMRPAEVERGDSSRIGCQVGQDVAATRGDGNHMTFGRERQRLEVDFGILPDLGVDQAAEQLLEQTLQKCLARKPPMASSRFRAAVSSGPRMHQSIDSIGNAARPH